MLGFFKNIKSHVDIHKLTKQAKIYMAKGDDQRALNIYENLVVKHPRNVYIRHETALLQEKLHHHINLPSVTSSPSSLSPPKP